MSVVPLEELIDRLKVQVERHKDWLATNHSHRGSVGPVDGFTMHYVVERKTLSVVDELRHGSGVFRIGVSQWNSRLSRISTVRVCCKPNARIPNFGGRWSRPRPDSALTFWVYPDSFSLFRKLQDMGREHHFSGRRAVRSPSAFGSQARRTAPARPVSERRKPRRSHSGVGVPHRVGSGAGWSLRCDNRHTHFRPTGKSRLLAAALRARTIDESGFVTRS